MDALSLITTLSRSRNCSALASSMHRSKGRGPSFMYFVCSLRLKALFTQILTHRVFRVRSPVSCDSVRTLPAHDFFKRSCRKSFSKSFLRNGLTWSFFQGGLSVGSLESVAPRSGPRPGAVVTSNSVFSRWRRSHLRIAP